MCELQSGGGFYQTSRMSLTQLWRNRVVPLCLRAFVVTDDRGKFDRCFQSETLPADSPTLHCTISQAISYKMLPTGLEFQRVHCWEPSHEKTAICVTNSAEHAFGYDHRR